MDRHVARMARRGICIVTGGKPKENETTRKTKT
jgi:hypothetical protein